MGRESNSKEAKVVSTNGTNITGSIKGMYYFLVGVSAVILVLLLMKLCYVNVVDVNDTMRTSQYYIWKAPQLLSRIYKETADGGFFTLAGTIPFVLVAIAIFNCIMSLVKAATEKISWKHAEASNRAYTSMLLALFALWLIYSIISPFFNVESGMAAQYLKFNVFIYITFAVALVGKVVAYFYFKQVKEKHLF